MARFWLAWLLALFSVLCTLGCGEALIPRTQVLVQIDADPAVKARASELRVALASGKGDASGFESAPDQLFMLDDPSRWPVSLALLPKGGDAERGFSISVDALEGGGAFVSARVISTFLDRQTLLLEIVLRDGCIDFMSCPSTQTCRVGDGMPACVNAKIDPRELEVISKVPDRARTDASVPGADAGDAAQPDASEPDASEPDASEPDAALDASEPDAALDAGACLPSDIRPEDCFNGRDDDCDQLADCADPECNAGAECTLDAPQLALKLPAGSTCPAGYSHNPRQLHRELANTGCSGCTCSYSGTRCVAEVVTYSSCTSQVPAATGYASEYYCPSSPVGSNSYGRMEVTRITPTIGTCTVGGTAQPAAISWGSDSTLCYLERKGVGCAAGNVCVPRREARALCSEGTLTCNASETRETWYSGVADTRSCGTCSCTRSGGGCGNISVTPSNSVDCSQPLPTLTAGASECRTYVSPRVRLNGAPEPAACTPGAPLMGAVTPTGETTLCCRP